MLTKTEQVFEDMRSPSQDIKVKEITGTYEEANSYLWEMLATRIDLVTLRLFMIAVEESSIAKTAARANITSSAVSKRLQDLETELDLTLFVRHARGISATDASRVLHKHCKRIFSIFNEMRTELSTHAIRLKDRVRLAANISAISEFLPDDLRTFMALYPEIEIELQEQRSSETVRLLREHTVEIGIFTCSKSTPDLSAFIYREDVLALAMREDHPFAKHESVKLQEIASESFLGLSETTSLEVLLREAFAKLNQNLDFRLRVSNVDALRRLVQAGLGVSVLPRACIDPYASSMGLCAVPIAEGWARRRLMVATMNNSTLAKSAQLLLNHLITPSPMKMRQIS